MAQITITRGDKTYTTTAYNIRQGLAVTKGIGQDRGWTVTHLASGGRFTLFPHREQAKRLQEIMLALSSVDWTQASAPFRLPQDTKAALVRAATRIMHGEL